MRERQTEIHGYNVTVYGGGVMLAVEREGMGFTMQGDDACQFMDLLEGLPETGAYTARDLLAETMDAIGFACPAHG